MGSDDMLAERFEEHRPRLRGVAFRMLGSSAEADDAVQEAWVRLSRADSAAIDNLGGWLTTVIGRVALDMLRSRQARQEDLDLGLDLGAVAGEAPAPEDEALLVASVGSALLMVLGTLSPSERLAFVLHDMFAVPFDQIGGVLDRSADATKQLAHRARRKMTGAEALPDLNHAEQRNMVDAFLAASRNGNFEALVELLHPDIVLTADSTAERMGSPGTVSGPTAVAQMFSGRALATTPALIDGNVGILWAVNGRPKVVWDVVVRDGTVVAMRMIADPGHLARLDIIALG